MSSLNIASRALTTNLAALQVVGHNIANANTPGFSRQSVQLSTAGAQNSGNGFFGKGVELTAISRAYNAFLTADALSTSSVAAADEARYQRLQQLESLFPLGEDSLGVALNNALNAWSAVTSSPTDTTARTVAIARAEELASRLRDTAFKLDDLRFTSETQLESVAKTINTLATKIAEVNLRIIEAAGAGRSPNDLLDQRDQLLADLNKQVQTTTVQADDGSLTVFIAGSQPLVLGGRASQVMVEKSERDPKRFDLFLNQAGQSVEVNQDFLGGGTLKGVLQFVNEDLPTSVNALGRLTTSLVTQVNAQHRLGLDLNGNYGGDFYTLAAMPSGVGLPGAATIQPSVANPTVLKATDYEFRFDPLDPNNVRVTRLADGSYEDLTVDTLGVPNNVQIDGLRFNITAGAVAGGDVYTFRPYSNAAASIDVAVAQPEALAAASPVKLDTQLSLTSSLTVESLRLTARSVPTSALVDVSLAWSSDIYPADPAVNVGGFVVRRVSDGSTISSVEYSPGEELSFSVDGNEYLLKLRGAPADGDQLYLSPASGTEMNQNFGNAQAMLDLRDQDSFGGVTLGDGYISVFSELAGTVQAGKFAAQFSNTAATNAETVRSNYSAVNLDEEAARLLQYQQAYQAVAKFLQTAQSTFDILINSFG